MKKYTIEIKIYNDLGELVEKSLSFPTLTNMQLNFWRMNVLDDIISEAERYAGENNMMIEQLHDSKEDADVNEEYQEDLSPNSPLNNPANFAN